MNPAEGVRQSFQGLQQTVRAVAGAAAHHILHPGDQEIAPHRHDWPFLALHWLGGYEERFDGEVHHIEGPSVVFHPAGRNHGDRIGPYGLESITLEFDPAWLGGVYAQLGDRSRVYGGRAGALCARALQRLWTDPKPSKRRLQAETQRRLAALACATLAEPPVSWLGAVRAAIDAQPSPRPRDIARRLDLSPEVLARTWRQATGEGLATTLRRRQVERAIRDLRGTPMTLAEVALTSGFCDQSHMNRVFARIVGRTPLQVRREAKSLRDFIEGTGQMHSARTCCTTG